MVRFGGCRGVWRLQQILPGGIFGSPAGMKVRAAVTESSVPLLGLLSPRVTLLLLEPSSMHMMCKHI